MIGAEKITQFPLSNSGYCPIQLTSAWHQQGVVIRGLTDQQGGSGSPIQISHLDQHRYQAEGGKSKYAVWAEDAASFAALIPVLVIGDTIFPSNLSHENFPRQVLQESSRSYFQWSWKVQRMECRICCNLPIIPTGSSYSFPQLPGGLLAQNLQFCPSPGIAVSCGNWRIWC